MSRRSSSYAVFVVLTVITVLSVIVTNVPRSHSLSPSSGNAALIAATPTQQWQDAKLLRNIKGHADAVGAIAISQDGQLLATGSDDQTIKLWNLNTGQPLRTFSGHSDQITALAISPNAEILVSGGGIEDGSIKLWNLKTGELINTFQKKEGMIPSLAITPDGKTLASARRGEGLGFVSEITLWNLETGKQLLQFDIENLTLSLAFSPNGELLASGSEDGTIHLWNWQSGEIRHILQHPQSLRALAFNQDGQVLVSESFAETINLWNPQTGELLSTPVTNPKPVFVNALALHPSGNILASALGPYGRLGLWNLQTGELMTTLTGFSGSIFSLGFSGDGQILVSGSNDGAIAIWRTGNRE
ncbi:MAG: WD40 repeat domain-containing protein [Coleofasciculus sp. G1-WW12-02]|uniref:WD40 repeat domain-containing protein n=1 Tax=Coleofasciculus sp. G1-WW12-02 TaxID=3068483 RepID=UPI0032F333D7